MNDAFEAAMKDAVLCRAGCGFKAIWSIEGCTRGPEDVCSLCFKKEHGADAFELARLKNEMHLCGPFGPGAEGCTLQSCFGEGVLHHMQPDECRGETWKPAECVL